MAQRETYSHGRSYSDEWYTPPHILEALGPFDMDASPIGGTLGLMMTWEGFVWLNPPYSDCESWVRRLADHGEGIALLFARTDTRWFHEQVFERATGALFLKGRLRFALHGQEKGPAPYPSVLVAYSHEAMRRLSASELPGCVVRFPTCPAS